MIEYLTWMIFLMVAAVYAAIITFFSSGWFSIKEFKPPPGKITTRISVIVPVRNERENIQPILHDLLNQDLPRNIFEVIIMDDASTDGTQDEIRRFIKTNPGSRQNLIYHKNNLEGKKAAIEYAVRISSGDLIVTTDADCRLEPGYLRTIAMYYQQYNPVMIAGPVKLSPYRGWAGTFQALEFLSLVGTGAGSLYKRKPIMCNGANLAYSRKAFSEVGGYATDRKYSSGDDIFLLHKISQRFGPQSVHFLKAKDAIVTSRPAGGLKGFMQQRMRWVSKSRGYKDRNIIGTALAVYAFNGILLVSALMLCFQISTIWLFLTLLAIKILVDFPVLNNISNYMGEKKLMAGYPLFQLMYIPYVILTGFLGNVWNIKWKDRKLNK